MKRWADKWSFNAEEKNGTVRPEYDYFIVTSNYTIEQIFATRSLKDSDEEY